MMSLNVPSMMDCWELQREPLENCLISDNPFALSEPSVEEYVMVELGRRKRSMDFKPP